MEVDWERFCEEHDVALVVPSKDRAALLARKTDRVIRGYHLYYQGSGYTERDYRALSVTETPSHIRGLPATLNWIMRTRKERCLIFLDDDVTKVSWLSSDRYVHLDTEQVMLMLINLVVNARDVGATLFGISEVDIRKHSQLAPFALRSKVMGLLGIDGRKHEFDARQTVKADFDFVLQKIRDDRVVWKDTRYWAQANLYTDPGGGTEYRINNAEKEETERLVSWWGSDIVEPTTRKGTESIVLRIPK